MWRTRVLDLEADVVEGAVGAVEVGPQRGFDEVEEEAEDEVLIHRGDLAKLIFHRGGGGADHGGAAFGEGRIELGAEQAEQRGHR
jgi:hypothetical protein